MKLRNDANRRQEPEECTLFGGHLQKAKSNRRRRSRHEIKQQRSALDFLSSEISVHEVTRSIDVIRPAHNRDGLYIRFDELTVGSVLHYLRNSTFSPQQRYHHHVPGVSGIHKRPGTHIVALTYLDKRVKHVTGNSVEGAVACVNRP